MNDHDTLKPEDYLEPDCPLCNPANGTGTEIKPVPQQRIIEKMDDYMSRRDYKGAERHLHYWLEEAKLGNDLRGQLMLRNELVGHYRKTGDKDQALANGKEALDLLDRLGFEGTISSGTTYTNVATAMNAFGENEEAMKLFRKARTVYEAAEKTSPELLGGLYNNMALTCVALGNYDEAYILYGKAMEKMAAVPNGVLEQAITCLNIANAEEAEKGMEAAEPRIFELLDKAYDLLNTPDVTRDGYYAFVCEKCAPTFAYYGYFMAAEELTKRAEAIYAGN